MFLATGSARDNENRTLDLLGALAHGKVTIDETAGNTVDKAFREGHFYSGGAPGFTGSGTSS